MKRLFSTLIACLMLAAPFASRAQTSTASLESSYTMKFPSAFRVGPLLGPGFISQTKGDSRPSLFGGVIGGYGRGMFSVEGGVAYMSLLTHAVVPNVDGTTFEYALTADYVGTPVWVKYNYIEKPLAAFFVKAGAIPLFLVNQSDASLDLGTEEFQPVQLSANDVLLVGGIGGTAPLTDSMAFVLDLSYFRGLMETSKDGNFHDGFLVNIGFSVDL